MAHPRRRREAEELRDRLTGLDATIVFDPDPDGPRSALRAARAAWGAVPAGGTHHLVLQDDVTVPDDFADRVLALIRARPRDPVTLLVEWGAISATPARIAALHGAGWAVAVDRYVPTCGLVLPTALALGFDAFAEARQRRDRGPETPPDDGADDVTMAAYLAEVGLAAYVAIPHVIEHDLAVDQSSLVGNTTMGLRRAAVPPRAGRAAPPATGVGPVPTLMPYLCWWLGQAVAMRADPTVAEGWRRLPLADLLSRYGLDPATADEIVRPLLRPARAATVRVGVHAAGVREVALAALALGLCAADGWPAGRDVDEALRSPVATDALASLAPGGLRRLVPPARLPELTEALAPVVTAAVRAGISHARAAVRAGGAA